jgi:hypothetical protein
MKTKDSNAILFTKTICDLAHIASLCLQYLADKVKYIDHLLPDDSTDLLGRQKRFMTLTPLIICLDKLKATKHSKLEFFFGLPIEPIVTVTLKLKHVKKPTRIYLNFMLLLKILRTHLTIFTFARNIRFSKQTWPALALAHSTFNIRVE